MHLIDFKELTGPESERRNLKAALFGFGRMYRQ